MLLTTATLMGLMALATCCRGDAFEQKVLRAGGAATEKRVAIIGGGAAGTSASYWLKNAFPDHHQQPSNIRVSTTLYERENYIGGRSTVVHIKGDPSLGFMELGASIYVDVNYNLMNATERFGLAREKSDADAPTARGLGIWDGSKFLYEETGNDYWDLLKVLWRYGYTPIQFRNHLRPIIDTFAQGTYKDKDAVPFYDVPSALKQMGLERLVNETASEYLEVRHGFSQRFVREIVQTGTRANYGQEVDALHAFGALVSMSTGGASSTVGGNFQIFEEFAKRSGAILQLGTSVVAIQNTTEFNEYGEPIGRYVVLTDDGEEHVYDAVLLAAPLHSSGIEMPFPAAAHAIREYHKVHVTMIAGVVDPSYFGRTDDTLPNLIVTTGTPLTSNFANSTPPFTTFGIHKRFPDTGESVVKIFSHEPLSDELLDQLFHNRSWTFTKTWEAFPELYPVKGETLWPPILLHGFEEEEEDSETGVIYINAFENCISTMETQTVASKNAVRLLRDRWCRKASCVPFGDGWGDQ